MASRWAFRFSLRTLVLIVVPLAAALSFLGSRWRYWEFERQMAAIEADVWGKPASPWTLQLEDKHDLVWLGNFGSIHSQRSWNSICNIHSGVLGDVAELRVPDWPRLVNLQEVEVTAREFGDNEMQYVGRCRKLTTLRLAITNVSGSGLSNLVSAPNLRELIIGQRLTGDDIRCLPTNLRLRNLELELTGDGLDALMRNESVRNVEVLIIRLLDNGAKPESLALVEKCSHLKEFFIAGPLSREQVAALAQGARTPHTISLVGVNNITAEEMYHFTRLERLKKLTLRNCGLTDADVAPLARATQLEWLDLENNPITSTGIIPFATLGLHILNLHRTRVDDSLLEFVRQNKGETHLSIDETLITPEGRKAIDELTPDHGK